MHFSDNFDFSKSLSTPKMPSAITSATFDVLDTQVCAFTDLLEVNWGCFAKAAVTEIISLGQAIHPMF